MKPMGLAGREYPVACYAARRAQVEDPESVLGALEDRRVAPGPLAEEFAGRDVFNGEIYAMTRLRVRPWLKMEARAGWYFDSLSTCEVLELGLRAREGVERTAGIGISTLVAVRKEGGYELLLGRVAGKAMPQRAGQLHVVPSGMMAPPYSVRVNVERELEEELGLRLNAGRLLLSGVAVNLRNQRPEICTVWVTDELGAVAANEEFLPGLTRVRLGRDEEMAARLGLTPESITPPGVAALLLGARVLRRLRA